MSEAFGHPGNKYGLKLKDPALRQRAYDHYCAHLAKGKSKRSWVFEEDGHTCIWETFESYMENEAEFDPIKMKAALSMGFAKWEGVCEESADGKNQKANTASLQMIMRNKFGWDKSKPDTSEYKSDIRKLASGIRSDAETAPATGLVSDTDGEIA